MAQIFRSRIVWIIDESGGVPTTVKFEKAYYDNAPAGWHICGDGVGAGDPGGALSITMVKGTAVPDLPDHYYYAGDCVETYTYTLEIDSVAETYATGIMLDGSEKQKDIATNSTHRSGDGSDHADVASNNAHRALVTTNPHAVDTSLANGVNLANVDNTSDDTKNSATATLTNKSATDLKINTLYNTAGTFKLTFPTITADDIIAQDGDLTTKEELVEELASGSTNSISVLRYVFSNLMNSEKFATMMAYAGFILTGTAAPTTTPIRVGQIYINTNTSPPDVYISTGTSAASDWDEITMV